MYSELGPARRPAQRSTRSLLFLSSPLGLSHKQKKHIRMVRSSDTQSILKDFGKNIFQSSILNKYLCHQTNGGG